MAEDRTLWLEVDDVYGLHAGSTPDFRREL